MPIYRNSLPATKRLITRPLRKPTQRTSQRSHQPSPPALRHSRPLPHSEQPHLLKSRKTKIRRSHNRSARTINLLQRSMRSTALHHPTATPVSKVFAAMLRSPHATRSTTHLAILLGPVHLAARRLLITHRGPCALRALPKRKPIIPPHVRLLKRRMMQRY
jgi:hypothetical protein